MGTLAVQSTDTVRLRLIGGVKSLETIQAEAQFAQGGGGGGCNNGGCGYSNGGGAYSNQGGGFSAGSNNIASSGCGGGGCGGGCRNGRCGSNSITGPLGNLVSGTNLGLAFPPKNSYQRTNRNNRGC